MAHHSVMSSTQPAYSVYVEFNHISLARTTATEIFPCIF